MPANTKRASGSTTVAVRIPVPLRKELEMIQAEDAHADLSDTLRLALVEFAERRREQRRRAA